MLLNPLSSNMGKRIGQIDSVIDSMLKSGRVVRCLQSTDIGFMRTAPNEALSGLNSIRSLMVGTIIGNRVNLSII